MNNSTKKWLLTKFSSAILIPLMIWFIINLVSIYELSHIELISFFSEGYSKILFSFFMIFAFFFSTLTISEIFEDYISDKRLKNVANKALIIFAIIMPLITFICINNFKI